jgi:hypothetical protein
MLPSSAACWTPENSMRYISYIGDPSATRTVWNGELGE